MQEQLFLPETAPLAACHEILFAFASQCGTSLGTAIVRGAQTPPQDECVCLTALVPTVPTSLLRGTSREGGTAW